MATVNNFFSIFSKTYVRVMLEIILFFYHYLSLFISLLGDMTPPLVSAPVRNRNTVFFYYSCAASECTPLRTRIFINILFYRHSDQNKRLKIIYPDPSFVYHSLNPTPTVGFSSEIFRKNQYRSMCWYDLIGLENNEVDFYV